MSCQSSGQIFGFVRPIQWLPCPCSDPPSSSCLWEASVFPCFLAKVPCFLFFKNLKTNFRTALVSKKNWGRYRDFPYIPAHAGAGAHSLTLLSEPKCRLAEPSLTSLFSSQGLSRFCQHVFGVSLTSLSARESGWMSRSSQVLTSGCSQRMRSHGLLWMLPLDGRDFPFQFTKHLFPHLSKNCSSHLSRGFESLEIPQRSSPALDLHQFSLSIWRMLCPGRTMGIVDAEKSQRQA